MINWSMCWLSFSSADWSLLVWVFAVFRIGKSDIGEVGVRKFVGKEWPALQKISLGEELYM